MGNTIDRTTQGAGAQALMQKQALADQDSASTAPAATTAAAPASKGWAPKAAAADKDTVIDTVGNGVGELIGKTEKVLGRPIYPINDYMSKVSDGLYRGSRPEPGELAKLKAQGFKSTVDLRLEAPPPTKKPTFLQKLEGLVGIKRAVNDSVDAKQLGMNSAWIPILDDATPTDGQMKKFLDFVTKPENQPAYVHCEAGKGRTGLAVAAYRMAAQGWPAQKALDEATKAGLGFDDQKDFIMQFSQALKDGKIQGYPLNPPIPS